MKIGDKVYFRNNIKEHSYISDIMGSIIWVVDRNVTTTDLFTPYTIKNFINFYITEKEMRKLKLKKIIRKIKK